MAVQPEAAAIRKIHKLLDAAIDNPPVHTKMGNIYAPGVPDQFYCGEKDTMWIEYKIDDNRPSTRQAVWIHSMRLNGENAGVMHIVNPTNIYWITGEAVMLYRRGMLATMPDVQHFDSYAAVVRFIIGICGVSSHEHTTLERDVIDLYNVSYGNRKKK